MIEGLVEKGHAYQANGDVYFRVRSKADYGKLSGRDVDSLRAGARVEPGEGKEDPADFALWKGAKEGEPSWESPWGPGRPGWHIECSAMAEKFLGPVFEIHGGGLDLVFPHHENEIAQSRGAGREFARLWMHNGMLRFVGEKMSKSLRNVVSLQVALDEWGRDTLLVFFLTAHWSKPIDFSDATLAQARAQWEQLRDAYRVVESVQGVPGWDDFAAVLDDDFNTPEALAMLHRWRASGQLELLDRGLQVFGLGIAAAAEAPGEIVSLAELRQEARARHDFDEADRLRTEIAAAGWEVQDVAGGFRLIPRS